MKIILITSDLTYAPRNYNDVLEFVLENSREHIAGIVLVKINVLKIFGKALYLYISGCNHIANTLMLNIINTLLGSKKKLSKKYDIPFTSTVSVNGSGTTFWIQKIKPDLILNMRARCIYEDTVLKIPRLGCVNLHHGIMPQQKGLFCDLHALADNRATGFTIHQMTNRIDQGKIFYQERVKADKNYMNYLAKTSKKESQAVVNFINKIAQSDRLPKGTLEKNDQFFLTTTPDFKTIKKLQRNGIIL